MSCLVHVWDSLGMDAAPVHAPGAVTQWGHQPDICRWLSLTDWQSDRGRLTNAVVPRGRALIATVAEAAEGAV